ncbi:hypothetical protein [Rhizobium sp. SL42]|nr:hypothetical protein [Rhizobium sp. SL42]UJW77190.1 hypothetical protein IM739_22235 [Rhizobium sp. SL42]
MFDNIWIGFLRSDTQTRREWIFKATGVADGTRTTAKAAGLTDQSLKTA